MQDDRDEDQPVQGALVHLLILAALGYVVMVATCGAWGLLAAVLHMAICFGASIAAPRKQRRL